MNDLGAKTIGHWLKMGGSTRSWAIEAPDNEIVAKLALIVAERGNAVTETLRAWSMDEVRALQGS